MVEKKENNRGHFYRQGKQPWYKSVTKALRMYPKGDEFYEWVAKNGYKGAKEQLMRAGAIGTTAHNAIERIIRNQASLAELESERVFEPAEWMAVVGFLRWWDSLNEHPVIHGLELPVISHTMRVGGTCDMFCTFPGHTHPTVVDFKTSGHMSASYWLQLHAYAQCIYEMGLGCARNLMILHLHSRYDNGYHPYWQPFTRRGIAKFQALCLFAEDYTTDESRRDQSFPLGAPYSPADPLPVSLDLM